MFVGEDIYGEFIDVPGADCLELLGILVLSQNSAVWYKPLPRTVLYVL